MNDMMLTGPPATVTATLAANRLGLGGVLSAAGAAIAPAVVVAGVISTGYAVTGVTSFPVALLAVALVLGLFCPGYIAMSKRIRNAGAFYTYIARGLGRPVGVAAAFVALPAYATMAVATYGAIGPVGSAIIADTVGVTVPWGLVAVGVWLLVTVLGALRISISARVLAVALACEVVVVLVADLVNLAHPHAGRVSLDAWDPTTLAGHWGIALAIAGTSFIGFEAAAVFSEESRGARTVALATTLALTLAFGLYALSGWAMAVTVGSANLQAAAGRHGPDLPFVTAAGHLGSDLIVDLGRVLFVSSLFAAALAYHNTVTRYAFALGREGVLPAPLARLRPTSGAPVTASLTISAVAGTVIIGYAAADADPLVQLFFWGGTIGALGVLLLIATTSASVLGFFRRDPDGTGRFTRVVAPALAALLLVGVIALIVDNLAGLLGVAPGSPLSWAVPAAYAGLAALGLGWAYVLRRTRPETYHAIGLNLPTEQ
ncbi:Amino acid transporter [Micromonospora pattaloongensis]|uniref:Amino acid transporter n=1 Tax=Micromonospora pattaloongensis TaxID=405436 RepID=A0A1H3JNJ2_9ACTN|nr:APC family permease [Micromonospora pattaloongensis]SDY41502.1 Amino acid transporter [Micromonospora pattaloongensis]